MEKKVYSWMLFFILLISINWGIEGLHNFNTLGFISSRTHPYVNDIVKVFVGICALVLVFKRDIYLPFLGKTVFPCSNLEEKIPNNHSLEIKVNVSPNAKVVYWASEPDKDVNQVAEVWDAYARMQNAGVVKANNKGEAVLKLRRPQNYKIPSGKVLQPHVHYRECLSPKMLGEVRTTYVNNY